MDKLLFKIRKTERELIVKGGIKQVGIWRKAAEFKTNTLQWSQQIGFENPDLTCKQMDKKLVSCEHDKLGVGAKPPWAHHFLENVISSFGPIHYESQPIGKA